MHDNEKSTHKSDPIQQEPKDDEGIGAPLMDTPGNLPGDQPVDDTPPDLTKATGDDA